VECMSAVFAHARLSASREPSFPESFLPGLSEASLNVLETGSGACDELVSKKILAETGVTTAREKIAGSAAEAAALAGAWGYPVVAKGLQQGLVHKTELNLVRLNLADRGCLEHAFAELTQKLGKDGRVLVQEQIPPGLELIVGLFRDPQFGPAVMVGLGGVYAEVLADKVFAAGPVTESEALAMLSRLKNQKLLNGFRGAAPLDRGEAARVIAASRLGALYARIREIDVNPLIVVNGRPVAVDATIVLG
jgi:acyl-CoA synthetase (NDP forming)